MIYTYGENKWLNYLFKLIPFIVVFTVGVFVGYKLMPEKVVVKTEVKTETKVVEVAGETKTEVRYLQKASNSDADVNIKTNNPTVSVNGKHCSTVKYFWTDGSSEISSTLMGGKLFE